MAQKLLYLFLIFKPTLMTPTKDGSSQPFEERNKNLSSDYDRVNNEDDLDTRTISNDIEEGGEDYDDEELDDDELSEDDFELDDEEEEDSEEEVI